MACTTDPTQGCDNSELVAAIDACCAETNTNLELIDAKLALQLLCCASTNTKLDQVVNLLSIIAQRTTMTLYMVAGNGVYRAVAYATLCGTEGEEVFNIYSLVNNDTLREGVTYYTASGALFNDAGAYFYSNPHGVANSYGKFTSGVYNVIGTCG